MSTYKHIYLQLSKLYQIYGTEPHHQTLLFMVLKHCTKCFLFKPYGCLTYTNVHHVVVEVVVVVVCNDGGHTLHMFWVDKHHPHTSVPLLDQACSIYPNVD